MTPNPPTDNTGAVIPPKPKLPPSGQELYDALMGQIEPELISSELPNMGARYAAETPEDTAKRASRYGQAFLKYQQSYEGFSKMKNEEVKTYRKASYEVVEKQSDAEDDEDLTKLDTQFSK
ncbi:MAG: hypothetical protein O2904_03355 [bacterium]|nr:hypothetical protein [bacterium]